MDVYRSWDGAFSFFSFCWVMVVIVINVTRANADKILDPMGVTIQLIHINK